MKIRTVRARQILDSRGNPTIEVDIELVDGSIGRAAVPSGASTGEHEALEKRDGGAAFAGLGVMDAVRIVEKKIAPVVVGIEADNQQAIDQQLLHLDGTTNKQNIGANAMLAVSLAVAKAASVSLDVPLYVYLQKFFPDQQPSLPVPMCNVINGGAHAKDSSDIQEYMLVPHGAKNFNDALRMLAEIYHQLKTQLTENNLSTLVGDEGGFAPTVPNNHSALTLLMTAIQAAGYKPGHDVSIALDVASSELYDKTTNMYDFRCDGTQRNKTQMLAWYRELFAAYPIVSIEDGLHQDDWGGWKDLVDDFGRNRLIVGDDLLVTNVERVKKAIQHKAATAVLIKPNQVGTLTETLAAMHEAFSNGLQCIISHRSGETEDTFIAHLAVASGCGFIKIGSVARGERTAKYNELIRIAETLPNRQFRNYFAHK